MLEKGQPEALTADLIIPVNHEPESNSKPDKSRNLNRVSNWGVEMRAGYKRSSYQTDRSQECTKASCDTDESWSPNETCQ